MLLHTYFVIHCDDIEKTNHKKGPNVYKRPTLNAGSEQKEDERQQNIQRHHNGLRRMKSIKLKYYKTNNDALMLIIWVHKNGK